MKRQILQKIGEGLAVIAISLVLFGLTVAQMDEETEQPIHTEVKTEAPKAPTAVKTASVSVSLPKVEEVVVEEEAAVTELPEPSYDVPLSEDLQKHIIAEAEAHGIDPAIIFAMAYRESSYRASAIGDNGNSFGLLQIQPRWHQNRMDRLGVTDLLDPYQNVVVGIDYLAEQVERYDGDIAKALVAYNAGHYSGTITQYAKNVLETAEEVTR